MTMTSRELARNAGTIARPGFEIVVNGYSAPGDADLRAEYAEAGATWWLENLSDHRFEPEDVLARVAAGPVV
jgi:hypothetical protein